MGLSHLIRLSSSREGSWTPLDVHAPFQAVHASEGRAGAV
jgi:hypothetical protein